MNDALSALESAIAEARRLEALIKKGQPRVQVTLAEERELAKATALAWFNSHKKHVELALSEPELAAIDSVYRAILESSDRHGARTKYLGTLKLLRARLVQARSICVSPPRTNVVASADQAPDFTPLVSDPEMQQILVNRWNECVNCLAANAPLAATVMMGGLLEGLLLARVNKEPKKQHVFTAKSAPKDRAGKTKPLSEWTLNDYIEIARELTWITASARDIGGVLRDYRNYIHPQKELSHGIRLKLDDSTLLWEVSKSIARQIIRNAP